MNPYIYLQSDVLTNLRTLLKEPTAERWTDTEIYAAMNMAITGWQGRVRVPYVYTISGGWVAGTYDYVLPNYIDAKTAQPQAKRLLYDWIDTLTVDGQETWGDILSFDIEPDTTGSMVIRVHYSQPQSQVVGASTEGRVIWWGQPGPVPTAISTLGDNMTSTDTSATLVATDPRQVIGRVGYVKIDDEWIQYAGYTEQSPGSSTLTLTNLVRGLNGTTAAAHSLLDNVTWGIAVDTPALLNALYDGARVYLMDMWLSNPSSRETASYEKQLVLYQNRVDKFWKGYKSSRPVRMRLSRQAIGDNL